MREENKQMKTSGYAKVGNCVLWDLVVLFFGDTLLASLCNESGFMIEYLAE